ncbi:MAG: thioredoxin domain-containing protein [Salinivirgaceae bacterium]
MKTFFIVTLLGIILLTSSSQAGNPVKAESNNAKSGMVITLTNETFKSVVFNYEKNKEWKYEGELPAIIDFYADWCGPCRQLSPRLEEIAKEDAGKIIIYKVNTDVEKVLSQTLGITSLPTLLFIPAKGKPQVSMGALPKETLVKAVNEVLLVK